ncbi:OB-fold nucleic acid binding domain-containing protein [Aphanothece sacrum]|uniref:OB-fold nucleic acid binding domain-containing protein n=1 Tax=Aphanothece sacrum TaxID=1122 RepID=UPI000F60F7A4|nr:OB-fold nucleic acid binding domain-containing protein [Aphanothece sacrum]
MQTKRIRDILRHGQPDETIIIQGWVRTTRQLKEFTFMEVNDGSSMGNLQVVIDVNIPNYNNVIKTLNTGSSVEVSGILVTSLGKGQRIELKASSVQVLWRC